MCISTGKLRFLDVRNYLAPGFSLAKFLEAYKYDLKKGDFPYDYMDNMINQMIHNYLPVKCGLIS